MGKLLLLFTIVPLVELYLLLLLGDLTGLWPTVAIVLATGVLGAWLAKREGLRVLRKWQDALAEHRMPEEGVLGGVLVLVGGVLLVTPGIVTDLTGFLLLIPPTRRFIAAVVKSRIEKRIAGGSMHIVSYGINGVTDGGRHAPRPRQVIEVEGEVIDVEASA